MRLIFMGFHPAQGIASAAMPALDKGKGPRRSSNSRSTGRCSR